MKILIKINIKKKTLTLLAISLLIVGIASAQTPVNSTVLQLDYDDAGNRIKREVITLLGGPTSSRLSDTTFYSQEDVKIYPNPTRGVLNVELVNSAEKINRTIEIYNLEGKLVKREMMESYIKTLDLSTHKNGIYYLNIYGNDKVVKWKVVKTD